MKISKISVAVFMALVYSCTKSHYSNDNNAPDLPPLLKEVMEIKRE